MPRHWILKTDPDSYSWSDLLRDGNTPWDGVRNYQARNNLKEMDLHDRCLIYHSADKELVGIATVIKTAYPDPTATQGEWACVDIAPVERLPRVVTLEQLKNHSTLRNIHLVRQGRLSVSPLTKEEYDLILTVAGIPSA